MQNKPTKKADTKLLLISWALGIALVIGYTIYWFIMAHKIEENLSAARNDRFSFSSIKVSGYPYRFTFIANNLAYKINQYETFKAEEISATASTLEPQLWVLEGMSAPKFFWHDIIYNVTPNEFKTSLRFSNKYDYIKRLSIETKSLTFSADQSLPNLVLGRSSFHLIKTQNNNQFATSLELNDINGMQINGFPAHNFKSIILRGLITKEANDYSFEIKYGDIFDGLSTKFQNISGNLKYGKANHDEDYKINGNLEGDIDASLPFAKISEKHIKIAIRNSKIDIGTSILNNDEIDSLQGLFDFYFNPQSMRQ